MGHSTEFVFTPTDGEQIEVVLEDIKLSHDGDGWNEPYSVTVEDYRVFWLREGSYVEVKWENGGVVSSTCPVPSKDLERFLSECSDRADEYASTAEPLYFEEDDYQ